MARRKQVIITFKVKPMIYDIIENRSKFELTDARKKQLRKLPLGQRNVLMQSRAKKMQDNKRRRK